MTDPSATGLMDYVWKGAAGLAAICAILVGYIWRRTDRRIDEISDSLDHKVDTREFKRLEVVIRDLDEKRRNEERIYRIEIKEEVNTRFDELERKLEKQRDDMVQFQLDVVREVSKQFPKGFNE